MRTTFPRILLSANTNKEFYVDAIEKCGGIAVAQYCPEFSTEYDGLLLCGGNDINPKYYNEDINGSVNIDDMRDEAEFELFRKFVEAKKPIFGICRGCQLINVALGGSLHQDIPNADEHRFSIDHYLVHDIKAVEDSFLSKIYGIEFSVNSHHHQAIKDLGEGIEIVATAFDGITVEAIKHKELPIYALQWHPEKMCFGEKRDDAVDGAVIFEFFIDLCKKATKNAL